MSIRINRISSDIAAQSIHGGNDTYNRWPHTWTTWPVTHKPAFLSPTAALRSLDSQDSLQELFQPDGPAPQVSNARPPTNASPKELARNTSFSCQWMSPATTDIHERLVQAVEIISNCLPVYLLAAKYWRNTNASLLPCHLEIQSCPGKARLKFLVHTWQMCSSI